MLFCPKWSGWESRPRWLSLLVVFDAWNSRREASTHDFELCTQSRLKFTFRLEFRSTRWKSEIRNIESKFWKFVSIGFLSSSWLCVRSADMNGFRLSFSRREKKENRVSSKCLTFESSGEESIWAWKLESRSSISPPREEAKSYLLLASSNCEGSSRKSLFSWVGSSECLDRPWKRKIKSKVGNLVDLDPNFLQYDSKSL